MHALVRLTIIFLLSFFSSHLLAQSKPNVVLILLDNTGWGDFGPYGGGEMRGAPSPNINQLASEGLTLTNFNTEPQCTPSRSALMTGRFAVRSGNQSVPLGVPYYGLIPWEETVAEKLKSSGYATAMFGKWHLGKTKGRFPTDQGFDQWYGIQDSSGDAMWYSQEISQFSTAQDLKDSLPDHEYPWVLTAKAGETPKQVKKFDMEQKRLIDGELTQMAVDYIHEKSDSDEPFFLYVPLTAMHFPTMPSDEFAGKSGHGVYTDMLMQTDHYVGQISKALSDTGLDKDTLFIFTADNGPEDPINGNNQYTGWTGPWRGTYFTATEGGLRTPFIAKWGNNIPAGKRSNEVVHLVDIFSTILAVADVEAPNDRLIDGKSMVGLFTGKTKKSPREGFPIFVGDELYAVKWRDWKAHFIFQKSKFSPKEIYSTAPKVINLKHDPKEQFQAAEPYNAWLQYPGIKLVVDYKMSQALQPDVPVGAPDSYIPPPLKSMKQLRSKQ
ncbi:MAG: sulfatase-like hydrolase/transferase [Colwellia sp.]|nr:sulfatase-like hydrolase/transferase [Colwellia sp.]MCW8863888.1 sulfatase-like hydrolase/transferase [Colwellia sp.]MCW9081170.1 sulfatase-like hydrolase/transferase [Colwellia sp.]